MWTKRTQINCWLLYNKYENLEVIQDVSVYKNIEVDSDNYLLCAKVNFPPPWLNKDKKNAPVKQEEPLKLRLLKDESIRWLYVQGEKLHLNTRKENEIDTEEELKRNYKTYCHHGMVRPLVADRGTASDMEGSCE